MEPLTLFILTVLAVIILAAFHLSLIKRDLIIFALAIVVLIISALLDPPPIQSQFTGLVYTTIFGILVAGLIAGELGVFLYRKARE